MFFPFLVYSTSTGGGDRLLTSQSSSLSSAQQSSFNIPWGGRLNKACLGGVVAQENTLVATATLDDNRFLDLFFDNKERVIKTFQWFIDKTDYRAGLRLFLTLSYFCLKPTDRQTIPFPHNWRTNVNNIREKRFRSLSKDAINYGEWIHFLQNISESDLSGKVFSVNGKPAPKESKFFWEQFFSAYLYFVGLSKTRTYSQNSFLAFLDNLKKNIIQHYAIQLSKIKWLAYLPGIDLSSLGSDNIDARWALNLDPDTLNLDSLSSQQLKDLYLLVSYREYQRFDQTTSINKPYVDIIKEFQDIYFNNAFKSKLEVIATNSLGIRKIFFNKQEYSLQNLFSFFTTTNQIISVTDSYWNHLAFNEMVNLVFADKTQSQAVLDTAEKLQKQFDDTKRQLLNTLKTALDKLQEVDPATTQLPINGEKYTIDQLLQATKKLLDSNFETQEPRAVAQIQALFSNQVYASDITKVVDQLKKHKEILSFLTKLATEQKLTSLKINGLDYSFTSLIVDLKKEFINFSQDSFTELQNLVDQDISLETLRIAYQESLPSSPTPSSTETKPETKSSTKENNNQNLAIGLGTAGGVVALAGVTGFVYWFLKIRKS